MLVLDGRSISTCGRVELDLDRGLRVIEGARVELLRAGTGTTTAPIGEPELVVDARRIERDRVLRLEDVKVTPCLCEGAPTFSIGAASAEIEPGRGVWLTWPVFYVLDLPVFGLPAFHVPLGERRSGLLLPELGFGARAGFWAKEPIFFTLGRSADLTLEPGILTRRGPSLGVEARWAPAVGSEGSLKLELLADFGVFDGGWSIARASPIPRLAITGGHRGALFGGRLAAELAFVSDPAIDAELAEGYLRRQAESTSSRVTFTLTEAGVRAAIGLALVEDLRPDRYTGDLREAFVLDSGRYRLLELRLDALPLHMIGPLYGGARLAAQGFVSPDPDAPYFFRADLRPELRAPIDLFDALRFEPRARLLLTGWSGAGGVSRSRAAVLLEEVLSTSFGRSRPLHVVDLELAHLYVPYLGGDGPGPFDTADELDAFARVHQLEGRLRSALSGGFGRFDVLASLGADLDRGGLTPLVVDADTRIRGGPLETSLRARVELDLSAGLELFRGELGFATGRDRIRLIFADLAGERASLVGLEELVPAGTVTSGPLSPRRAIALDADVGLIDGLRLAVSAAGRVGPGPPGLDGLGARLRYASSCRCFDVALGVELGRDLASPTVTVGLDLARLGGEVDPSRQGGLYGR